MLTNLSFGEVERDGDLVSSQPGQVVVVVELVLELPDLLLGESCPLLAGLGGEVELLVAALLARHVTCKKWILKKEMKRMTIIAHKLKVD